MEAPLGSLCYEELGANNLKYSMIPKKTLAQPPTTLTKDLRLLRGYSTISPP